MQKTLVGGPWFYGSKGLDLTKWKPGTPTKDYFKKMPIWIRLKDFHLEYWDIDLLK